ncbi:MAG: transaldolase, partial [Planctomycetota bacterium]
MPNAVPTAVLSMAGQSIWIDNITRAILGGTLQKHIADWSVVGPTPNQKIFAKTIAGRQDYDAQ